MQLKQDTEFQNGKYRIIRVLGQGGFGITYLAEHTMLDKMVAIKEFFPKDYCDRDETTSTVTMGTRNNSELVTKLKRRFLKEAKNIAKLDHPGIVKIHDIFEENNTAYYVMDYIKGITLSEMVKQYGALSEEKAIGYITKVGEALEYMHSNKMTHFDVKPANIIVADKNDMPVLIDFGLSKQYSQEGEETSTLLQAVSSGFSPIELYSPESFSEFSPQTDVYSLAATLYYLLSGCVPPPASNLISNQLQRHPSISDKLFDIIQVSTNHNIINRYKTVEQFCKSLKYILLNNHKANHYPIEFDNEDLLSVKYRDRYLKIFIDIFDVFGCKISFALMTLLFISFGIASACDILNAPSPLKLSIDHYKSHILFLLYFALPTYISTCSFFIGIYLLSRLRKIGYMFIKISLYLFMLSILLNNIFNKNPIKDMMMGNIVMTVLTIFIIISLYYLPISLLVKIHNRWKKINPLFCNNKKPDSPFIDIVLLSLLTYPILCSVAVLIEYIRLN